MSSHYSEFRVTVNETVCRFSVIGVEREDIPNSLYSGSELNGDSITSDNMSSLCFEVVLFHSDVRHGDGIVIV